MIFYDTETVGLYGVPVTIQHTLNGDIELYEVWKNSTTKTLELIDRMMEETVVAFNMVFDHFHLNKIYNMFKYLGPNDNPLSLPAEVLMEAELESQGLGALRPKGCLDLMLHLQKGDYQKCMDRDPIIIKKVPVEISKELCALLNDEINFDEILFANRKTIGPIWNIAVYKNREREVVKGFVNIQCVFHPSFSLKNIVKDLGLSKDIITYGDVGAPFDMMPVELGFAPYALALENIETKAQWELVKKYLVRKNNTKKIIDKLALPFYGTWPHFLRDQVNFWGTNEDARTYAKKDVYFLEKIYDKYKPEVNDTDSILACCVASTRLKGYKIDIEGFKAKQEDLITAINDFPDHSKPAKCAAYLYSKAATEQKSSIGRTTDQVKLEKFANRDDDLGKAAQRILNARRAKKELDLILKLLVAGRFYPSFKIIGALSSRMSGSDGLNPQGIKRDPSIRSLFPLADDDMILCGGDFDAFEVSIFEAVSKDPKLREELLSGKKIHGIFGTYVFPDLTYEEILADKSIYNKCKSAVFAMLYGGEANTLMTRLGVEKEVAEAAYNKFLEAYPGARQARLDIKEKYSPLRQDASTCAISWHDHEQGVSSLLNFTRYFESEFSAAHKLYDFASKKMMNSKLNNDFFLGTKILRSENKGLQSLLGAAMSATYAAAFNIQSSIFRQAGNHRIQSTGAQITKEVQKEIWLLQPVGHNDWVAQPMNIHDEIMASVAPNYITKVKEAVDTCVEYYRELIPLIEMEWKTGMKSWGEK